MDDANLSLSSESPENKAELKWFALRDLKRANSKTPGYKELAARGIEGFTPMRTVVKIVKGKRKRMQVPALSDLLFAHSSRAELDPVIDDILSLQYRYARGGYCVPIVIRDDEMDRFIRATSSSPDPKYYSPDELSQLSIGKSVIITDGPMQGMEAKIVNVRGARKKRILVSIPGLIAAVVEVDSQAVTLVKSEKLLQ